MKNSRFNFFYDLDNENKLAYNSLSNSLATISKSDYEKYSNFINDNIKITDDNLIEELKKGNFIIDDDFDEIKLLRYRLYKSRFNENHLGLTIAPTANCNFRCVYCYEKNSINTTSMSQEVENEIIKLVENKILSNVKSISVAWYGGEPLLRFDIVERISNKIIELCNKNDVIYTAFLVTNGYLLTNSIAEKMLNLKILSVQVTIDGNQEIHDSRRFLVNGEKTFEKIIQNLSNLSENTPNISLRINVDKKNVSNISEINDILIKYNLKNKVVPYLGHVRDSNGCYDNKKCISLDEFSKVNFDFKNFMKNEVKTFYPTLKGRVCGADSENSFVISADGEIFKCWDDIGIKEKSIGNILDKKINISNNIKYIGIDPTNDETCSSCKVLPICMGGCPVKFDNKESCTYLKNNLELYLKKVAYEIKY